MITDTQGLSTEDVRKYFQRICEEAEGLMRDYDPRMILEWTDTNLIDGACFQVDVRIQKDGAHTGSIAMTLAKEDIMQLGGIFGAAVGKGAIADYSLNMNLREVVTHGKDAATAKVTWREHVVMQAAASEGEESTEARGRFTIEAEADCVHLVVRDEGRLALGMALCSGTARLSVSD
ncbi:hypothetical protein [Pusillimonas sp.]|uniref:hypothetical protein n=1 Tax=Pusillimonas sp. TaxID=3040095 RepID=UPI0037CC6596